jgi:hypothetical protein
MLSTIPMPGPAGLAEYTEQVRPNGGLDRTDNLAATVGQHVVPTSPRGSSPIKHMTYIVNENRTYDPGAR